jgi:hypothetical protein
MRRAADGGNGTKDFQIHVNIALLHAYDFIL